MRNGSSRAGSTFAPREEGIAELKLQPWGTLIGRLVDEDGGARAKVDMVYRRAT